MSNYFDHLLFLLVDGCNPSITYIMSDLLEVRTGCNRRSRNVLECNHERDGRRITYHLT